MATAASSHFAALAHNVRRPFGAWRRAPLASWDAFLPYVERNIGEHTGKFVLNYAQKRLGKLHYTLGRKDAEYAKELMRCQTRMHAEVAADIFAVIAARMGIKALCDNAYLSAALRDCHARFVASAPAAHPMEAALTEAHLAARPEGLAAMSVSTGRFLFGLLPMTDTLLKSNVEIFIGHVRTAYANIDTNLAARADWVALKAQLPT